jgi:hypothetical protein
MNLRIYNRCIEVSKALKPSKESGGKSYHTTFAIRKSKIVCIGFNNYQKKHNSNRFGVYKNHRNLPGEYNPSLHSEISMCIKLGQEDLSDYEILNIRIDNNNNPVMSQACPNCRRILQDLNPKRVYHSNANGELEELILE